MKNRVLEKYRTRLIIAAIFLITILVLRFLGVGQYLTLANFKSHRAYIQQIIQNHYWFSVLVYILLYTLVVSLSLPAAAILTIVGGFLFGVFEGAFYANIGATIGASIAFLIIRYALGSFLQEKYADQLATFNKEFNQYGSWYLLGIHLITIIPFFVINTIAGMTQIPFWTFVWTTALGIIPGSLVYTYAGRQLLSIEHIGDIFSPSVLTAFLALMLLSLSAFIYKRFWGNKSSAG